jgi:UDP-sulfoquinovose synthase
MRVLILGGDDYLGWPTAMYLSRRGHEVALVDNYFRRRTCTELNREPLIPVPNLHQRAALWEALSGCRVGVHIGDVCDYPFLLKIFGSFNPRAWCIMPSSPRPPTP